MKEINVTVKFEEGLHARPAVKLIEAAKGWQAKITLVKDEKCVRADSITAILAACILSGEKLTVRAEGPGEEEAIKAMEVFFN